MSILLGSLRPCFEGAVPAVIGTCARDGTPNVALLSQVHYVNESHVALSYQFFNKTRENILANPRATVQVVDPVTAAHFRLQLQYLRTETAGPLFENMKAKLAGIASHSGMSKVFRLLGSDVYRVTAVERVFGEPSEPGPMPERLLTGLRACLGGLTGATDLARLFDAVLDGLDQHCGIRHAILLVHDTVRERLYTVATRGYSESGVGSELLFGEGIIGVAARERTPIRIGYAAREYLYGRALRDNMAKGAGPLELETSIPLPGLADSMSQLAVPILFGQRLLGVLYVESPQEMRFTYADEDVLAALASQVAITMELLSHAPDAQDDVASTKQSSVPRGTPVAVRHFAADHSVFIDNDYLIKGVAGAIFWKLLSDFQKNGRSDFTNRELRLDPALKLPDICDNLEARLILLQRRLSERCPFLAIEKTGRGRFRLRVDRPILVTES